MTIFRVYHFPVCPFSRTLRIVLKEKNQVFEMIIEKQWEHREGFLHINPAGTLPVMIAQDDTIIRGLYPTIEYIEELGLQPQLLLGDPEHKAHIRYVFDWFMHKFHNEVTRYILSEKIIQILHKNGSPNSAAIRAAKKNILYHLDYIAYLLSENTYLCGERITIADCIATAQLSVLDLVGDIPWEYNGKVKAWYALMKSRPSVKSVLTDEMHGITIPSHYTNPDF